MVAPCRTRSRPTQGKPRQGQGRGGKYEPSPKLRLPQNSVCAAVIVSPAAKQAVGAPERREVTRRCGQVATHGRGTAPMRPAAFLLDRSAGNLPRRRGGRNGALAHSQRQARREFASPLVARPITSSWSCGRSARRGRPASMLALSCRRTSQRPGCGRGGSAGGRGGFGRNALVANLTCSKSMQPNRLGGTVGMDT